MLTRVNAAKYFGSKALACFLCGGIIATAPLIASIVGTALFIPMVPPEVSVFTSPVSSLKMLSDIYYSNSYLYILFYLSINFFIGGILACLSLCLGFFFGNRILVTTAAFIANVALLVIGNGTIVANYAPSNVLNPSQLLPIDLPAMLMVYGLLAVFVVATLFLQIRRHECL